MLKTDDILQGRYRILRHLGRGGMGAVYEAADMRLSRNVALKETLVETDELRRAFEREARLLANLRHPALPKVLDHFAEGAGLFLVMEYIPGDDLGLMLEREGGHFSPEEVMRWAAQLLDALEYLHGLDPPVLHRDIKPGNLKLISREHIVLLDFGLAKGAAGQMTRTGSQSLLGYSPNYSPLEQMQGTGTDRRSDLYSLGATLYHLLTGVKPLDALSRANALVNNQPDPLRPARELNAAVTASVSAALMRAMALNIENRPRTASEMRDDLRNLTRRAAPTVPMTNVDEATRVSSRANRAGVPTPEVVRQREAGGRVVIPLPEETRVTQKGSGGGRRWVVGAALLTGLAILSAAVYLLFLRGDRNGPARADRPVVVNSPRPTPSPTAAENVNEEPDIPVAAEPTSEELAARAKLEQKRMPFTEEAFTRAVEEGDTGAAELFLAAGMSPEARDAAGRTALINAASRGRNNISQKLLGKGADVNARDAAGSTALMGSAEGDHKDTTKVLLENGADVNLTDNNGRTALIRAAARGNSEIVRMLINQGARVDVRDKDGRDALTWAEINDRSDVTELLRKAGAGRQ
jgi:hypothetical protein